MRIINASETGTLVLGFQGEDQRLEIRFPLVDEKTGRNITEEFPGGSFSISIMLPGDPAEHIVGSEDFRIEGNWLIWTVKEAYTVGFGEGKLQLNYAFGGMAKSRIWKTSVRKSISTGAGTVPSWSDWKTELLTAAAAVQSAVDSYDEMTAAAEELPAGSAPTAEMDHTGDHPVLRLGIPAGQGGGGDVQSVNGKTGTVVLDANDVGALPASTPIPPAVTVDSQLSGTSVNPVQNKIIKAALDSQSETIVQLAGTVSGKYEKPSGGIPASDLAEAVQTSLGKADTALQESDIHSPLSKILDVTLSEEAALIVTEIDGVPLSLEEVYIELFCETGTVINGGNIYTIAGNKNNGTIYFGTRTADSTNGYFFCHVFKEGGIWVGERSGTAFVFNQGAAINRLWASESAAYTLVSCIDNPKITQIQIPVLPSGARIKFYAR